MLHWASKLGSIAIYLLLALASGPAFAQVSGPFCDSLFESLDSRIVNREELTDSVQLQAIELLGHGNILHYTTLDGLRGILRAQRLIADGKRRVFVTREGFSQDEAERALFINSRRAGERGSYVVILRPQHNVKFEPQASNPFELLHQGSYRFADSDVLYAGVNPF